MYKILAYSRPGCIFFLFLQASGWVHVTKVVPNSISVSCRFQLFGPLLFFSKYSVHTCVLQTWMYIFSFSTSRIKISSFLDVQNSDSLGAEFIFLPFPTSRIVITWMASGWVHVTKVVPISISVSCRFQLFGPLFVF